MAILVVGAAVLMLAAPAISHAENAQTAQDITPEARLSSAQDGRTLRRMRDGKVETYSKFAPEEVFSLTWPAEAGVGTAYVKWYTLPDCVILVQSDEDGMEISRERIDEPGFNDCYPILPEARALSLVSDGGMQIAEITLYSEGTLPDGVYSWLPPLQKADLLLVSAHCDDEFIFFGGTIPYYAGERKLGVQVVYMANGERARVDETLNGLWHAGVRNAPVFMPFKDVYTESLRLALLNWGEEETTGALVSLIRRFQPEVIVTHDLEGEYGHGAHIATAVCMLNAVPLAADASVFSDSFAAYGAWQAQKLYLHLYPENRITMDWNQPLPAFGGKTALEVANEAYHMHVSQLKYHSNVYGSGQYSSLEYGLAYTVVGPDAAKEDFFEHIDPARLSDYIAPTAAPTETPAPAATLAPTARPTAAPTVVPEASTQSGVPALLITGAVILIAAAAAVPVFMKRRARKTQNSNRSK